MRDDLVPKLDRYLAAFNAPFVWGVRDCVTLAAGWVKIVTGEDLIPPGLSWNDEASASAALAAMGVADVRALASKFLPATGHLNARMGDILARQFPATGWGLGICVGCEGRFCDLTNGGTGAVRLTRCSGAWRVG